MVTSYFVVFEILTCERLDWRKGGSHGQEAEDNNSGEHSFNKF